MNSALRPHHSIGLALGGGAARGWAHIGVVEALLERGIVPQVVAGCSIGALVGAAYAGGRLAQLRDWVGGLTQWQVAGFFELRLASAGFVDMERLRNALGIHMAAQDALIEQLPMPFAAVATELASGREVWMEEGSLLDAVTASIALPGLFAPTLHEGRWLVDGGLVNPVPVSLCRALGADIVIAVQLGGGALSRYRQGPVPAPKSASAVSRLRDTVINSPLLDSLPAFRERAGQLLAPRAEQETPPVPGMLATVASSVAIMQDRIMRSRMAGDPPDVLLNPRVANIELLEFHRAEEAIAEGRACVERQLAELEWLFGGEAPEPAGDVAE